MLFRDRAVLPDSKTGPQALWLGKAARKVLAEAQHTSPALLSPDAKAERLGHASRRGMRCGVRAIFSRAREWKGTAADASHLCALLQRTRSDLVRRILSLAEPSWFGKAPSDQVRLDPVRTALPSHLRPRFCRLGWLRSEASRSTADGDARPTPTRR